MSVARPIAARRGRAVPDGGRADRLHLRRLARGPGMWGSGPRGGARARARPAEGPPPRRPPPWPQDPKTPPRRRAALARRDAPPVGPTRRLLPDPLGATVFGVDSPPPTLSDPA